MAWPRAGQEMVGQASPGWAAGAQLDCHDEGFLRVSRALGGKAAGPPPPAAPSFLDTMRCVSQAEASRGDSQAVFIAAWLFPNPWDAKVSADLAGQIIIDFRMARDGGIGVQGGIMPP
jgi:hypothetical protein